jgi:hypothetical protein
MPQPRPQPRPVSDRTVERAVRFIEKLERETALDFAMDVGRYLFERIYDGRVELLRTKDSRHENVLARIARDPRVRLSASTLLNYIHVHLLVEKHGRNHPGIDVPHVGITNWATLYALYDDDETLFRVLSWVEKTGASAALVKAVVQTLSGYIAAGGRLEDLLVDRDLFSKRRTPFGRITRMLGIERTWLRRGLPISKRTRDEALELIGRIEQRLRSS